MNREALPGRISACTRMHIFAIANARLRSRFPLSLFLPLGKKVRATDSFDEIIRRDSRADPSDPRVAPVLIGALSIVRYDEIITNQTQLAPHPTLRAVASVASPVSRCHPCRRGQALKKPAYSTRLANSECFSGRVREYTFPGMR
jgi:hypothetical protein